MISKAVGLKTIELTVRRTIPATPAEVYDAWLDPRHPGNPWHDSDMRIFEPARLEPLRG